MVERSRAWESSIQSTATMKTENYVPIKNAERYFIGYLGELALETVLYSANIRFDYKPRLDGIADCGDFTVYRHGRPNSADVKTAAKEFHQNFMIPEAQRAKHRSDLYIGARLTHNTVQIIGWMTRRDCENLPVDVFHTDKTPTAFCPLDLLRDIADLIGCLDRIKT